MINFIHAVRDEVKGLIHILDAWMNGNFEEKDFNLCLWSVIYIVADKLGGNSYLAAKEIAENFIAGSM